MTSGPGADRGRSATASSAIAASAQGRGSSTTAYSGAAGSDEYGIVTRKRGKKRRTRTRARLRENKRKNERRERRATQTKRYGLPNGSTSQRVQVAPFAIWARVNVS